MTSAQLEKLDLGIAPLSTQNILMVESAFHWINDNTTYNIDYNDDNVLDELTPNIKMFLIKYFDVMSLRPGISSESLGGMSQSFHEHNKSELLWEYAYELFGNAMRSQMSFVSAKRRWY